MQISNLRIGSFFLSSANANVSTVTLTTLLADENQCLQTKIYENFFGILANTIGFVFNVILIGLIVYKLSLRRYGLLLHQASIDGLKSLLILPMEAPKSFCKLSMLCPFIETAYIFLTTLSSVNLLAVLINDSPIFPYPGDEFIDSDFLNQLNDFKNFKCVIFGLSFTWFISLIISLGPALLSGTLVASFHQQDQTYGCELLHSPYRHYVLNVIWALYNSFCASFLTYYTWRLNSHLTTVKYESLKYVGSQEDLEHLANEMNIGSSRSSISNTADDCIEARPGPSTAQPDRPSPALAPARLNLHESLQKFYEIIKYESLRKVRMYKYLCLTYWITWLPLFIVIIVNYSTLENPVGFKIALNISYFHSILNPLLFIYFDEKLEINFPSIGGYTSKKRCSDAMEMIPTLTPPSSSSAFARRSLNFLFPDPPPQFSNN